MSETLLKFRSCCGQLSSDKVTERKKQLQVFKQELGKTSVCRQLDENSENGRGFTWEHGFDAVRGFMSKEVEYARVKAGKGSTVQSEAIFKWFVQKANNGGDHLHLNNLVEHIAGIIHDEIALSLFGMDCCTVVSRELIGRWKYRCKIQTKVWQDLLKNFCRLLLMPPPRMSFDLLSRLVHQLMTAATDNSSFRVGLFFSFFKQILEKCRSDLSGSNVCSVLCSLNVFSVHAASDCRGQLCRLGEESLLILLQLWKSQSVNTKDQIVSFLRLQMCIHHPKGALTEVDGAYTVNGEHWKELVQKMYEILYEEWKQAGNKLRLKGALNKEITFKPSFINLTADVCHQVFSWPQESMQYEVSQLASQPSSSRLKSSQYSTPSKRRRLESGWQMLQDNIQQAGQTTSVIPWLQLTEAIISKYPHDLPLQELQTFTFLLSQIQADCKRGEVQVHILRCLSALAKSQSCRGEICTTTKDTMSIEWSKVWAVTLRTIGSRTAETEGFSLLGLLLEVKLVAPGRDVWQLFMPSIVRPTEPAVKFLLTMLHQTYIPEKHVVQPEFSARSHVANSGDYPLRHYLLEWLLPSVGSDEAVVACGLYKEIFSSLSCTLHSTVLLALTQKNTDTIQMAQDRGQNKMLTYEEDRLDVIEHLYLASSFNGDTVGTPTQHENTHAGGYNSLKSVAEGLILRLLQVCIVHDSAEGGDIDSDPSALMLASLVCKVMAYLQADERLNLDPKVVNDLLQKVKGLLTKVTSNLRKKVRDGRDESMQTIKNTIRLVGDIFSAPLAGAGPLSEVVKMVVPRELLEMLLGFVQNRSITRREDSTDKHQSKQDAMEDDFDEDFDSAPQVHKRQGGDDDDEFDVPSSSAAAAAPDVGFSVDGPQLSVEDEAVLQSSATVAQCCVCVLASSQTTNGGKKQINGHQLLQNLLEAAEDQDQGAKNAALWVEMVFTISESLLRSSSVPNVESLQQFLQIIRGMASSYRRDQRVCCRILQVISSLIPRLMCDTDMVPVELLQARETTMFLLSAFWTLLGEDMYTAPVRLEFMKCFQALMQADPDGKWAVLRSKAKERGQGDNESGQKDVKSTLVKFLTDASHVVRVHAASNISRYFKRGDALLSKNNQNASFDLLYQTLQDGMVLKSKLKPNEQADESANRTSTLLVALSCIAKHSPACLKKVIFALVQAIKFNGLEISVIQKVLNEIYKQLGHSTNLSFLEAQLGFLIDQWMVVQYPLGKFPHDLFECSTIKEFYQKYHQHLIPYLVLHENMESVQLVAQTLARDWKELIRESFPSTISFILPLLIGGCREESMENSDERKEWKRKAAVCLSALEDALTKELLEYLIQCHLDVIVVQLLARLYEPYSETSDLVMYIRDTDAEPNAPHFDANTIHATLLYLTKCHSSSSNPTLILLLAKSQDSLQKIFLALHKSISKSHSIIEKHRSLLAFHLFVALVLKDLATGLSGGLVYVVRTIIYTLLNTIKDLMKGTIDDLDVSRCIVLCVDTLSAVCNVVLDCCTKELCRYLQVILGVLVSVIGRPGTCRTKAIELINFLVVKNTPRVSDALKFIDPLPDLPDLRTAREKQFSIREKDGEEDLMDSMTVFLMKEKLHSVEGLKHLKKQLEGRKEELALLVAQCAEEGSDSALPQAMCVLIGLCKDGGNKEVQQEAAACLGEVGAPNLSLITLQTETSEDSSTAVKVYADDSEGCRNAILLHMLNQYLMDPDVETIEAASTCLKNIFRTSSGQRFFEDYKSKNIDTLLSYLLPFKAKKKKNVVFPAQNKSPEDIVNILDSPLVWQPSNYSSHAEWVKQLCVALIKSEAVQDEFLRLLDAICTVKVEFAELLLPYLILDILLSNNPVWHALLSSQIGAVFKAACEGASDQNSRAPTPVFGKGPEDSSSSNISKASLWTLLKVIHHLRTQHRPATSRLKSSPWDNNFWLDLDYLLLAKAAQLCNAHFTSLLYAEIWCDTQKLSQSDSKEGSQDSVDTMSSESGISVQNLLLEAYSSIGEPDSLYGCGAGRMTNPLARIQIYEHEGSWTKAVLGYDLVSSNQPHSVLQTGLTKSLHNAGLNHVLQVYLQGLRKEDYEEGDVREAQYEAAWKNSIWDAEERMMSDSQSPGFHQSLYTAFSAIRDGDQSLFNSSHQSACGVVTDGLSHVSLESIHSVCSILAELKVLKEVHDVGSITFRTDDDAQDIFKRWENHNKLVETNFEFAEMSLTARIVALQLLVKKFEGNQQPFQSAMIGHLFYLSKLARTAKRFQIAEKGLQSIQMLETGDLSNDIEALQNKRLLEEAKLFWEKQETTTGLYLMATLIKNLGKLRASHPSYKDVFPEALTLYGNWMFGSRIESPNIIMENYLEKAVMICESVGVAVSTAMESYLSLARFADAQYQQTVNYMKSNEYEAKRDILNKYHVDVEHLEELGDEKTRYFRNLKKQSELDKEELQSLQQDKISYLYKAMEYYLKYLQRGNSLHDIRVFRICSLWFDNATDVYVNNLMMSFINKIPSCKFLPMLYQLAARMTSKTQEKEEFYQCLNQLIEKTGADHPHHSLPIILALANANKDATLTAKKGGRLSKQSAAGDASHADLDQVRAAEAVVNHLRAKHGVLIQWMERLADAYIELAYWDVTQYKKETKLLPFPSHLSLMQMKQLKDVAMPTVEVPIDPSCKYNNIITVVEFEKTFKLAGGINLPKIICCLGSDGVKRRQLVKGRDDLRQDAVMQQVFGLVNELLEQKPESRQRKLHIRRYKVVPLSQRSGILEWCEGTMPIGEYLIGNQKTSYGAHRLYRPNDWTSHQCRRKMQECTSDNSRRKHKQYLMVMEHFKPVFRHFFFEKFLDPAIWFEKRLAYTRSVATCCIVGYVVGLGDRHVQNILVDCNSAELIHIDLGVAFEQGRILPTPETVPFRLTRDLVDGMGVAGVEGVFRRCCEKTMEVMRNNQEALLTVLEVLLYDPLYDWTMSAGKALTLQNKNEKMDGETEANTTATNVSVFDEPMGSKGRYHHRNETQVNTMAERALLRLKQKLQGLEEGVPLSLTGQINHLIQEARDPENLCKVFPGWQPWI